jgi:uncharacterized protein (DUF885 family)
MESSDLMSRFSHASLVVLSLLFLVSLAPPARSQSSAIPKGDLSTPFYRPEALPQYTTRIGEPIRAWEDKVFDYYVDRILSDYYQFSPESATNVGIHDFDSLLTDTSREGIEARLGFARNFRSHFALLNEGDLTPARRIDYRLILNRLDAIQFALDSERDWEMDPNYYVRVVSSGVQSLLRREFAPLEVRVRSLTYRLSQVPQVFENARANLKAPPRIYTEIAIEQSKGLVRYLEGSVVEQTQAVEDATLRSEFQKQHSAAVAAAKSYADWLESELLARSVDEFALGESRYRQKLLYEELIDADLDGILERAYASLDENDQAMREAADRLPGQPTVEEAFREIDGAAPAEGSLLEQTKKELAAIREFLEREPILTLPAKENLLVEMTPPFRRSTSFASMSSPGVLERNADEAYYYVTPPNEDWSAERKTEFLSFFNPYSLRNVSVHEAYPGHYYQFVAMRRCPSTPRALWGSRSNSEGWAHYCEQMMIEAGLGSDDPRYRIAQLRASSIRLCRLIAGISMHTRGMTREEAAQLFEERGRMSSVNAAREARRGTIDPTYGVYTLGKWQILDLREDFRRRLGENFQLKDFHDRFLTQGRAPLPLVREAMMASLPAPGLRKAP